ncbi:hypothetical protein ACO0RG_003315 [Hanseniaspora osmophila]
MAKSPKQLQEEASNYKFNKSISLQVYLTFCISLIEKARILATNSTDTENAYIFYMRYLDLVMNKLCNHPDILISKTQSMQRDGSDVNTLHVKTYHQILRLEVPAILKIVEEMQKKIETRYQKEMAKHYIEPCKTHVKPLVKEQPEENHCTGRKSPDLNIEIKLPSTFDEHAFNNSIEYMKKSNLPVKSFNYKPANSLASPNNKEPELPSSFKRSNQFKVTADSHIQKKNANLMLNYNIPSLTTSEPSLDQKMVLRGSQFKVSRSFPASKPTTKKMDFDYPELPNICI